MRKMIVAIAALGLVCGGCSWFGWGDDSNSTTTTPPVAEAAEVPEAAPVEDPVPAPKANGKTAKASKAKKGAKTEAQIKAELDQMGRKLAAQSARTLLPNKAHKEVKQVGGQWVATYMEVNADNVTTEMRPGNGPGHYVGFIRYQERVFECRGATRQAALQAPCQQVRTRNLNELIRYDGRQWQD